MPDALRVDLAPTLDDFRRLTAEVIDWPLADTVRWKIGNVYRGRMRGERATDPACAAGVA